jgi:peptidoglycan/xylan/chitin deacetylase (PgdA/CDA1 family)
MKAAFLQKMTLILVVLSTILVANGCSSSGGIGLGQLFTTPTATATATDIPTTTQIPPTSTPAPTQTPEPTLTPTPALTMVKAGQDVDVPILLYHHIAEDTTGNRYYITPETFATQMKWLHDHHFQTITTTQLANAIIYGGQIPERAVVISFDDGDQDVITNALPVMQKYGFIGTAYIIVSWIDSPDFDTTDQIKQLIADGWEIGSHSMSHVDLTQNEGNLEYEVRHSQVRLHQDFGVNVKSLAYPFGVIDATVVTATAKAGYSNGAGLGTGYHQGLFDLFYLIREEVRQEYSMDQFIALLPPLK